MRVKSLDPKHRPWAGYVDTRDVLQEVLTAMKRNQTTAAIKLLRTFPTVSVDSTDMNGTSLVEIALRQRNIIALWYLVAFREADVPERVQNNSKYQPMLEHATKTKFGFFIDGLNNTEMMSLTVKHLVNEGQERVINDDDVSSFIGHWRCGTPNGFGVTEFVGGFYIGNFVNGVRHGLGCLRWTSPESGGESKYCGFFKNDQFHGEGTLINGSGDVYDGEMAKGVRNGLGSLTWAGSYNYQGEFKNDHMHGLGILYYPPSPFGTAYHEGHFHNSRRHGPGTFCDEEGNTTDGHWVDDELSSSPSDF